MAKRFKLLFYWEPFALSVEQFDDQGQMVKSTSTLLSGDKTALQAFEELDQQIENKYVDETSLLIRQSGVMLQQYTIPKLKDKEHHNFLAAKVKKDWEGDQPFYWSHLNLRTNSPGKSSVQTFAVEQIFIKAFIEYSKRIKALPLRAFTTQALAMYTASITSHPNDKSISLFDDENSLLLVMVENSKPVLLREMPYSSILDRETEFERLSKEIQRTWLYAKQQYKFFPNKVIISGSELFSHNEVLAGLIDEVTIEEEPVQDWKMGLFQSSVIDPANLIPKQIQAIKQTLKFAHVWTVLILIFLSAAIFWNIFNRGELSGLNEKIKTEKILTQIESIQAKISERQSVKDSIHSLIEQANLVQTYSNKPIPAYLLMYISENIPDELVIRNLLIQRDTTPNQWKIRLSGLSPRDPIIAAKALKGFSQQTRSDLQRLNLNIDWEKPWLTNLSKGNTDDVNNLIKPFRLEGLLHE